MDYQVYRFSVREWLWNITLYIALAFSVSYLFYRSWMVFVLALPFAAVFLKWRKQSYIKKRQQELSGQFLVAMQAVSVALTAGYSIETSFAEALHELSAMYEKDDMIMQELHYITAQLNMNRNLEELLTGLACRSGIEDIRNFADIFTAAKRTGGNLIAIIRNTVQSVSQKEETKLEIRTCLSAKCLEQNIMSLIPCLILVYVQVVSPGFLDVMYHNTVGILVMTLCLGVYGGAWYWGRKIVTIEV